MSRSSQGNRGRSRGGGAQRTESPMSVSGRGQASSSPMSEDGNDKEILNRICQLHQQIRADHKPIRADHKPIMSAIVELKTEIENLIYELDDSEENTEEQKNPAKSKPVVPKATESGTNKSKDLYTVATTTKKKCRKLNSDLVKTRKELKEISELAVAVEQDVGFQPETSRSDRDKDSLSFNAKGALEDIKRMNKELSKELNKLSQNIERYSTDQPEQQRNDKNQQPNSTRQQLQTANQTKKTKDQSEEKKDHNSSKFDTNLEIISKAVRSFDDLQLYKRTLSEELNKLSKNIENYSTDQTEQQPKQSNDRNQSAIGPGKQHPQQTTKQTKAKKDDQSDVKRDHESSQVDTNLEIISKVGSRFDALQQYKSAFEAKMSQVLDFAMNLEEMKTELIGPKEGSGTEVKNKQNKGRSKKEEEGHDGSNADPPVGFDKRKFEQAIQLLPKVYKKLKDELSSYKQMLNHVWKTTTAAANHITGLARNNTGPGKFQVLDEGEVQRDAINQFNQHVVNMIKDIEGLVDRDTRSGYEIEKLKREIERKGKENEVLHNRLSKLAGNKMTEGNPNIANLGDPNRPTKIAEIYSEIYDNEWTDTLDFCLKKFGKEYSEDEALQALNKTLIICYKICQEKSDEWIQKTKEKLQHCLRELMVDIQSDEILMQIIQGRKVDPDKRSQQLLKEIRPKKDLVATKYAKEMNSNKLCKMIIQNKFFEKCFTLCWKMIVQNPRLILVEGPARGQTYDRTIFREFTSSGSKVVFTVWPALYLHEDGPLLVKGVVKVE